MKENKVFHELLSYDFNAFVEEKIKLKESIKEIKKELDIIIDKGGKTDDKTTFLISYLITSINTADDIDYLVDWSRQTTIEAMTRVFLENFAEYYQLATKFNNPTEIQKEINYLYLREIRRCILSFQRTMGATSMQNKSDLLKSIKETVRFFIDRAFASESTNIDETDDTLFMQSINNILKTISNDASLIDKNRIDLGKRNGGSDFVSTALNAIPAWGATGYDGNEILYGILSETVHANLTATLSHSQENGKFTYVTKNPNIVAIINLLNIVINYMKDILLGLGL